MILRSFLYVDTYKLRSLSAQLFGGHVDSSLRIEADVKGSDETQKGPVASGRIVEEIASRESRREDRMLEHDYEYTRVEEGLRKQRAIVELDGALAPDQVSSLRPGALVLVTGVTTLIDYGALAAFVSDFNKFGAALHYLTTYSERRKISELIVSASDRNKRAGGRVAADQALKFPESLQQDKAFVDHLSFILARAYGDRFELHVRPGGSAGRDVFTGILDRAHLREPPALIATKYSREAQGQLSMLGLVTRRGEAESEPNSSTATPNAEAGKMRHVVLSLALQLENIEQSLTGVMPAEIVLDPIAVYHRLTSAPFSASA